MKLRKIDSPLFCQVGQKLISKKEINLSSKEKPGIVPVGSAFICEQIIGFGHDLKLIQTGDNEEALVRVLNSKMNIYFEEPNS